MAVTFTISGVRKNIAGNLRSITGLITASGTTTDNGDALTAAQLGLHTITDIKFQPAVDSVSNPENAAELAYIPTQTGLGGSTSGVVVFYGGAASGSPNAALTDAATVTGYSSRFQAWGT